MSRERSIVIKDIEVGANEKESTRKNIIRVDVNYRIGGINYMSGDNWPRGYYLSICPMTVGNGFTSFIAFSGRAMCLQESKRFSQKVLGQIAADIEANYAEKVQPHVDRMLASLAEKKAFVF